MMNKTNQVQTLQSVKIPKNCMNCVYHGDYYFSSPPLIRCEVNGGLHQLLAKCKDFVRDVPYGSNRNL